MEITIHNTGEFIYHTLKNKVASLYESFRRIANLASSEVGKIGIKPKLRTWRIGLDTFVSAGAKHLAEFCKTENLPIFKIVHFNTNDNIDHFISLLS